MEGREEGSGENRRGGRQRSGGAGRGGGGGGGRGRGADLYCNPDSFRIVFG